MSEFLKIRMEEICRIFCPFGEELKQPNMRVGSSACGECKFNAGTFVPINRECASGGSDCKVHNEESGVYILCLKKAHTHSRKVLIEKDYRSLKH